MKNKFLSKSNIPNYLTIFRIVLTLIIITLLLLPPTNIVYQIRLNSTNLIAVTSFNLVACLLFIIASLTDFLDGYLARKYTWISNFGKFWDPLADKILTNSVLFCLASSNQNLLPIWIPIIFLIRDIVIDGVRMFAINQNIVLQANIYGKIKTFILMIAIIFILFFGSNELLVGKLYYWLVQMFLIYVSVVMCIMSAIIYIYPLFIRKEKEAKNEL